MYQPDKSSFESGETDVMPCLVSLARSINAIIPLFHGNTARLPIPMQLLFYWAASLYPQLAHHDESPPPRPLARAVYDNC